MPTSFLTGLSTEVKPFISGLVQNENVTRYTLVNSRNYNRKIIRSGQSVTTQKLGIIAPTSVATGAGGTGTVFYYRYVYVNKLFVDPLALEALDPYIRSNGSDASAPIASGTTPPTITGTDSTDPQVTHAWLYVSDTADGLYYRLLTGYEATAGALTWAGTTTIPTTGYGLEIDNYPPDTCRIGEESNGFFSFAGFVPISTTASATIGASTVTGTAFPDGIIGLNLQFTGDTTGGPTNNGIHLAVWVSATTLQLVNVDGSNRNYDGPSNKTSAPVRIWRSASAVQISKRYNPDFTPGIIDPDFLINGTGPVTGIAKPQTGMALRYHYNNQGKKSVDIVDFTQGVPPRRVQTASVYAMCNPRAYASGSGRMFYYDFDSGIIEDKGMQHVPVSLQVIPNLIQSLAKNSADISEMEYDDVRNLILLAVCPSGYTRNYFLIVYNLTTNAFNLWFMLPDVLAMRRIKDPTTGAVVIKMGSTNGSYTSWPSVNFNEAVGSTQQSGVVASVDDSTHLTVVGTPFPTSGDKLIDRWVMVWDDSLTVPVYQFSRISNNTTSRLTLDTFIGPTSTTGFDPIPGIGNAYWCGPIQAILGPNYDFNAVPDDDGQVMDVTLATSGQGENQVSRLSMFRNTESTPSFGQSMIHNLYNDSSTDPDHQTTKLGATASVEVTGITGWQITDNNESPLSIKALVKRIRALNPASKNGAKNADL